MEELKEFLRGTNAVETNDDEEVLISEELEKVDQLFQETGFEPIETDINPFDPLIAVKYERQDRTDLKDDESYSKDITQIKTQIKRHEQYRAKQKKLEAERLAEIERRKAEAEKRRAEAEKKAQEEAVQKKKEIENLTDMIEEDISEFKEYEAQGDYMNSLKKYTHLQKLIFKYADLTNTLNRYQLYNDLMICRILDIPCNENGEYHVDYSTYTFYGEYDFVCNKEACFKIFTISLHEKLTVVCLAFNDIVYVPADIIRVGDKLTLHEEIRIYAAFQTELLKREHKVDVSAVSKRISEIMHEIMCNQPGWSPDKFMCVKHKSGLVMFDKGLLNKCQNTACTECMHSVYCKMIRDFSYTLQLARIHKYEK
jgi:hypothetical protein